MRGHPRNRLCRAAGVRPLRGLRAVAPSLPAQAWTCPKSSPSGGRPTEPHEVGEAGGGLHARRCFTIRTASSTSSVERLRGRIAGPGLEAYRPDAGNLRRDLEPCEQGRTHALAPLRVAHREERDVGVFVPVLHDPEAEQGAVAPCHRHVRGLVAHGPMHAARRPAPRESALDRIARQRGDLRRVGRPGEGDFVRGDHGGNSLAGRL